MDPIIPTVSNFKMIADYGVAIVALFFVTRFLMWLIKYILERNKQREDMILELATKDLKAMADSLSMLTQHINNFSNSVNEAHKFQREEHKEMIDNLQETSIQNKEIVVTLGRINGYKDDHK